MAVFLVWHRDDNYINIIMPIQVTIPNPNGADGQPVIFNSGGGNGGSPDYISYAGPPVVNPPALQNIIVDVNGQQWQYYQGAWH